MQLPRAQGANNTATQHSTVGKTGTRKTNFMELKKTKMRNNINTYQAGQFSPRVRA